MTHGGGLAEVRTLARGPVSEGGRPVVSTALLAEAPLGGHHSTDGGLWALPQGLISLPLNPDQ